jgi:phage-related protein
MWNVELFEDHKGRCLAEEFVSELDPANEQPFIDKAFERLEKYGHTLRRPYCEYLSNDIDELRIHTTRGQIRFLYFFFERTNIIITHGFRKKSDAVDPSEIRRAIDIRANFLERKRLLK